MTAFESAAHLCIEADEAEHEVDQLLVEADNWHRRARLAASAFPMLGPDRIGPAVARQAWLIVRAEAFYHKAAVAAARSRRLLQRASLMLAGTAAAE